MLSAIALAAAELLKFLCKWGMDAIDKGAEGRHARAEIRKEIKDAKDTRGIFLGITRHNAV